MRHDPRPPYQPGDTLSGMYFDRGTTLGPVVVTSCVMDTSAARGTRWKIQGTASTSGGPKPVSYTVNRNGESDYCSPRRCHVCRGQGTVRLNDGAWPPVWACDTNQHDPSKP
ncbi:hypothetical protein ACFWYW_23860 [Nonomuraea sp. NPDC059023]|uniref:hypothetical protein n=1 Tax=unclassified Nonomuraea TaxID=2593643 RepID=UPI0036873C4A